MGVRMRIFVRTSAVGIKVGVDIAFPNGNLEDEGPTVLHGIAEVDMEIMESSTCLEQGPSRR